MYCAMASVKSSNTSKAATKPSAPLVSNQATIRSNLVENVIVLCDMVEELKENYAILKDTKAVSERLNDVHLALCELMHSMIASPLTGRIFLSTPEAYVTEGTKQDSFQTQFASRL